VEKTLSAALPLLETLDEVGGSFDRGQLEQLGFASA